MGMDVYGINPVLNSEKPKDLDWENSTEQERDDYFEAKNRFQNDNPGAYFRASIWSWRPIHMIIETINQQCDLGIDTTGFDYNDGRGIKDPEVCKELAKCIREVVLASMTEEDSDTIYLNLGSWVKNDGTFIHSDVSKGLPKEPLIMTTSIVTESGDIVHPSHSVDKDHLEEFCTFLEQCGGFEIW